MARWWNPETWVSLIPNGMGHIKPHHLLETVKTAWKNKGEAAFAWRILTQGVCDGCALGTTGMQDFTLEGLHLCTVRLNLLHLNTMPALDLDYFYDHARLASMSARDLRELGRLPYPMCKGPHDRQFQRISWEEAYRTMAATIRATPPERQAYYLTSRGITNEVYYVAQKVARFLGTNHVDNSARTCHAPSTIGLKDTLGIAASTCTYQDWMGTDLLVFLGSNVPNNQPVTTKYIYYAKQKGTRVVVINPHREPGLERYWVPSVFESALFGTKITDAFFSIHSGGDIAFLNGVLKALIEMKACDEDFISDKTVGWDELKATLQGQAWEDLEAEAGTTAEEMRSLALMLAQAKTAVFVWSMGITQHAFGVQNVKAIVNLALARGFLGRDLCGLMPIRGHSGVQGGAEMGCVPNNLPGGVPLSEAERRRIEDLWGFPIPTFQGLNAVQMIDAAHAGEIDVLFSVGGNFLETLPEPAYVRQALERPKLRIHQDIVLSPQMFAQSEGTVILLPAQTRYEQRGGGTETSTERRILFSPEIKGRRIGESKPEWEILMELAEYVFPEKKGLIHFEDADAIRHEIAKAVPFYDGIQHFRRQGDTVQWGGRHLCKEGKTQTPDGKGHFTPLQPPGKSIPEGKFWASTRRGKQFNSMVQAERDPLTGAFRDHILMSAKDAAALGLREDQPILLRSEAGEMRGRVKIAPIKERNIQVHWPEGNVLLKHGLVEPLCGIPDYNAIVTVIPLDG